MTIARLTGDWINQRIGPTRLLRGGSALAAIALGTLLVIADPGRRAGRAACSSASASPTACRCCSAARAPATWRPPGPSIAAVSSMGSIGFLVGPPFIGFLAEATSLPLALDVAVPGHRRGRRAGAAG